MWILDNYLLNLSLKFNNNYKSKNYLPHLALCEIEEANPIRIAKYLLAYLTISLPIQYFSCLLQNIVIRLFHILAQKADLDQSLPFGEDLSNFLFDVA